MTYLIPLSRLGDLQARVEKANRKAARLGCQPLVLEIGSAIVRAPKQIGTDWSPSTGTVPVYRDTRCRECSVTGTLPHLNGWQMVASVQLLDGHTIVRTIPGQELPEQYRVATDWCDHCKSRRGRNDVFVLRHDNGRHCQVGKTCLTDFLGSDTFPIGMLAELLAITDSMRDDDDCGGGDGKSYDWLDRILPLAAATIRKDGWVSRSANPESNTASRVSLLMSGPGKNPSKDQIAWHTARQPTEDDQVLATSALEWAQQINPKSDYEHDLKTIAEMGYIDGRGLGLAVSIVSAYQRHIGKQYLLNATVKGHEEYRGIAQTVLTRCSVVS